MKSNTELKHLCLEYMAPWLPNLTRFLKFPSKDAQRIKMNSILEELINITVTERGVNNTIISHTISYFRDSGRSMLTWRDLTWFDWAELTWRDMTWLDWLARDDVMWWVLTWRDELIVRLTDWLTYWLDLSYLTACSIGRSFSQLIG